MLLKVILTRTHSNDFSQLFKKLNYAKQANIILNNFCSTLTYELFKGFEDEKNVEKIRTNIRNRKSGSDVDKVLALYGKFKGIDPSSPQHAQTRQELTDAVRRLPNATHPHTPIGDQSKARTIGIHGNCEDTTFKKKTSQELALKSGGLICGRTCSFSNGSRSYHLCGELASLQEALVLHTIEHLLLHDFQLISVPDLVPVQDVEACGFHTGGERTQVYKLPNSMCLAGTGEMAIASYLKNRTFEHHELPLRLATVSRCYRAETSDIERERGLYRVPHFTKVEMFGVSGEEGSGDLLQELHCRQVSLFSSLRIPFRVLDMPTEELGLSAHQKFDVETWLPAKQFWAELSSASNCTSFQGERLNATYRQAGKLRFCHTVNGTACAIPRLLIALLEHHQQEDGSVLLPECLHKYMPGGIIMEKKRTTTRMDGIL